MLQIEEMQVECALLFESLEQIYAKRYFAMPMLPFPSRICFKMHPHPFRSAWRTF